MSDFLSGDKGTPTAHNAADGGAQARTSTDSLNLTYGVARNANEFRNITSNKQKITAAASAAQISTVFVQELNVPAMCQIVYEVDEHWSKDDFAQFKPGAKLEISDGGASESESTALPPVYVCGMTLEASAEAGGRSTLTVTAFDKMHFLRFGAYTKPFVQQDDSSIFESLLLSLEGLTLSAIGLKGGKYPYVLQDNESAYDFLLRRCREANYEYMIAVVGGTEKLIVRSSNQGQSPGENSVLVFKQDVEAITLDMRVPTRGSAVRSWGYDIKGGDSVMGDNDSDSARDKMKGGQTGFAAAAEGFLASPMTLRRPDLNDKDTLDYIAAAARTQQQDVFIEGSATLRQLNFRAAAGVNIELKGMNALFDGWYYIVKSTHQRNRRGDRTIVNLRRSGI